MIITRWDAVLLTTMLAAGRSAADEVLVPASSHSSGGQVCRDHHLVFSWPTSHDQRLRQRPGPRHFVSGAVRPQGRDRRHGNSPGSLLAASFSAPASCCANFQPSHRRSACDLVLGRRPKPIMGLSTFFFLMHDALYPRPYDHGGSAVQ